MKSIEQTNSLTPVLPAEADWLFPEYDFAGIHLHNRRIRGRCLVIRKTHV